MSSLLGGALICGTMVSCVGPYGYGGPNQSIGGVLGAGTGALAGAVIGNQSGRPLEGAAIGGAIGALAGSAIGNAQDQGGFAHRQSYYGAAPVVYDNYYQPTPVIVQRRFINTGWGGGFNRGWGGGGWGGGGWGGGGWGGGGWGGGGGGFCAPPPCW